MSKLKSETARINGAKSHGPVTPEGLAKSSANSRTHGLAAKYALLPNETREEFRLLFDDYVDQFHPRTGVETELVEVMVIARCRLRRLLAIETHLFEVEISRRDKQIDREFANLSDDPRLAWVFQKLADNGASVALLIRYEGSINRSYEKALKQLLLLQSRRPTPPPSPLEARPSGSASAPPPRVRSAISNSPDLEPDGVGPAILPASRLSGRLGFEARPSGRAPSEPRPCDVGPAVMPASRLSGRLGSEPHPSEPRLEGAAPNPDSETPQPPLSEPRPSGSVLPLSEPRPSGSSFGTGSGTRMPDPSKTPIQPQKPTSTVNPTIPVRDSVS